MDTKLRQKIVEELMTRCNIITKKTEWYEYCFGMSKAFYLSGNIEAATLVLEKIQTTWKLLKEGL